MTVCFVLLLPNVPCCIHVGLFRILYICTAYDRMFCASPAKSTVHTPKVCGYYGQAYTHAKLYFVAYIPRTSLAYTRRSSLLVDI
jgi:hypothetical protein